MRGSSPVHVAVIPAREGSVGFPHKNRLLFSHTAEFLSRLDWLDGVVVSTDDPVIVGLAEETGYDVHRRPAHLAGCDVSIKSVFQNLVIDMGYPAGTVLWLIYLPVMYRDKRDFDEAKVKIEAGYARSLCTFIKAGTHPYDTWSHDPESGTLAKFIDNDVFRRQDKPDAWEHYHYVCCLFADEVDRLNSELIGPQTLPVFLDERTASRLVEVDAPQDLKRWEAMQKEASTSR